MVEFAHHMGARVVNFFFMVCTGRGEKLTHITPEQYEEKLCGGCHARPHASHGDYLDEDLWCQYKPGGGAKIGAAKMSEEINMKWTKEAEERLNRLPFFLRNMIKGNVEKYAKGHGISCITPERLDELRRRRFGDKMPGMSVMGVAGSSEQALGVAAGFSLRPSGEVRSQRLEVRSKNEESVNPLPWTKEALRRLEAVPEFMRGIFREAAEEFAKDKGHLEVNVDVWESLEELAGEKLEVAGDFSLREQEEKKGMEWTEVALREIENRYSGKAMFAKIFMSGIIKEDIEMFARSKGITRIDGEVLRAAAEEGKVMVEWAEDAWERLQKAPDFIRSGIKKAAERRARREGITLITSELLTQFRNMAMMKAVKRIKALGYSELSFDAFDEAKQKFRNIKESREAQERLDEIREYVTSKGNIGLIDEEMLKKMKEYLNK